MVEGRVRCAYTYNMSRRDSPRHQESRRHKIITSAQTPLRQVTFVSYKPSVSLSSSINIYPSVLLFYSPFLPEHQPKRYPRRHQPPARAESPLRRLKISNPPTSPCGRQLDEPTYPQRDCVADHGRVVTILLAETATVHHDRELIPSYGNETVIWSR